MNREIKLRAWDKETKRMVKVIALVKSFWGNCEQDYISTCGIHEDETELGTEITNSYNYDLMQYTGIKDINGKEIFEGDIVKCQGAFTNPFAIVKYNSNRLSYVFEIITNSKIKGECNICNNEYEVVGNIYENLELLESDEIKRLLGENIPT